MTAPVCLQQTPKIGPAQHDMQNSTNNAPALITIGPNATIATLKTEFTVAVPGAVTPF